MKILGMPIEVDVDMDGTACTVTWNPLTGLDAPIWIWASPSEREAAAELCALAWGRLWRAHKTQAEAVQESLVIPDRYTGVKS